MSVVLTTEPTHRSQIADAFARSQIVVVALCAAWCETCNAFRADYERLATSRPDAAFIWLDIEDDADVAGDVDVENFPTLAIFRGYVPLHFGISLPHASSIGRLIDALAAHPSALRDVDETVVALPNRIIGGR
jgi:thioredoxin reductase (NADPH)